MSSSLETHEQQKIRLCLVNPTRADNLNKLPGVIYEETTKFSEYSDEAHVIVFHKRLAKAQIGKKVFVHGVPLRLKGNTFVSSLSIIASFFVTTPLLIWTILRCKINLLRADDILLTGLPTVIAAKITGIPVVIFSAGSLEETLEHKLTQLKMRRILVHLILKLSEKVEKFVLKHSNYVFAVTSTLKKRALSFGAQKVSWSPTFLNLSLFKPSNRYKKLERDSKILFVGRLEPEKGVNILIKAARILRNENLEFLIVGDGTLRGKIKDTINQFALNNVRLLGSKSHVEMPQIYSQAGIFVLPSFTEGAPVAMLEAMASGLPVIVTSVGIIPELIVNEVQALIIPKNDAYALATAIRRLANDETLRINIRKNGREMVLKNFGGYVGQHLKVYKSLVKK